MSFDITHHKVLESGRYAEVRIYMKCCGRPTRKEKRFEGVDEAATSQAIQSLAREAYHDHHRIFPCRNVTAE